MRYDIQKYEKHYSEVSFWKKLGRFAKAAGKGLAEQALRLFYVIKDPGAPKWAKGVAVGALGYFISPIDVIPDIIPVAGFMDDLGVIATALVTLELYVTPAIKEAASQKLREWFG